MTPHPNDEGPASDSSALVPAPRLYSPGIGAFAEVLAPILAFADSLREAMIAAEPKLREFAQRLVDAQEFFRHWETNAPAALNHAICSHGLIVPMSQMSLPDLVDLLAIYEDQGDAAVVQRLKDHYAQIFGDAEFLEHLSAKWSAAPHLERRRPLLEQALKAHKLGLFGVSIPAFISQFEGLVADVTNHSGVMRGADVLRYVASLAADDGLTGRVFLSFVNNALLVQFKHGSLSPPFSRHAILHGGDTNYATEINSRTAILLIDNMRVLTEHEGPVDVTRDDGSSLDGSRPR